MSLRGAVRAAASRRRRPPVFLHIGAMKTGTTYLQQLMDENRLALAGAGILWPGETWRDQMLAVSDILATTSGGVSRFAEAAGMWQRVTAQMLAHDGQASVLSMEFLSYADAEQAAEIVASFPDREVHVVITVRDARNALPAQWQTSCRMAGTVPLPNLVTAMAKPPDATGQGRAARLLQRTQGIPRMLDVWTPLVGAQRVHVVTVPPRGSDPALLWERFAGVLGISASVCAPPTSYLHTSLGHTSTELLRLVNVALGPAARTLETRRVKRVLVSCLLPRAAQEPSIRLDRRGLRLAGKWNRAVRSAITASGVHVVGSLDDLSVGPPPPEAPEHLATPGVRELLEAAAVARECLERHRARLVAELAGDTGDAGGTGWGAVPEGSGTSSGRATTGGPDDPEATLEAEVSGLADLVLECIELGRQRAGSPT